MQWDFPSTKIDWRLNFRSTNQVSPYSFTMETWSQLLWTSLDRQGSSPPAPPPSELINTKTTTTSGDPSLSAQHRITNSRRREDQSELAHGFGVPCPRPHYRHQREKKHLRNISRVFVGQPLCVLTLFAGLKALGRFSDKEFSTKKMKSHWWSTKSDGIWKCSSFRKQVSGNTKQYNYRAKQ